MMKHLLYLIICVIGLSGLSDLQAQDLPLTRNAVDLFQMEKLDEAKEIIDQAVVSETENKQAYTWFVHGFIYKELYKKKDQMSKDSEFRHIALKSAEKSIQLDSEKKYFDNNSKAISFIAAKYYNDALESAQGQSSLNFDQAYEYFDHFVEASKILDPDKSYTQYEKDIHKQVAESYQNLFLKDTENKEMLEKAIEHYKMALEIDQKDYDSNYNLAINYYNSGVRKISAINHKTPIHELMMIQEDCVELFKLSLPYMMEAHTQTKKRVEPLKGLMAIYRALNEDEKSTYYQDQLEASLEEND